MLWIAMHAISIICSQGDSDYKILVNGSLLIILLLAKNSIGREKVKKWSGSQVIPGHRITRETESLYGRIVAEQNYENRWA